MFRTDKTRIDNIIVFNAVTYFVSSLFSIPFSLCHISAQSPFLEWTVLCKLHQNYRQSVFQVQLFVRKSCCFLLIFWFKFGSWSYQLPNAVILANLDILELVLSTYSTKPGVKQCLDLITNHHRYKFDVQ